MMQEIVERSAGVMVIPSRAGLACQMAWGNN
jgi:hypothetical protein